MRLRIAPSFIPQTLLRFHLRLLTFVFGPRTRSKDNSRPLGTKLCCVFVAKLLANRPRASEGLVGLRTVVLRINRIRGSEIDKLGELFSASGAYRRVRPSHLTTSFP